MFSHYKYDRGKAFEDIKNVHNDDNSLVNTNKLFSLLLLSMSPSVVPTSSYRCNQ